MNVPFGIAIIIVSIFGYWYSWKSFSNRKKTFALLLLVLIGLLLRVYLSVDFQIHDWDERYHALVAKNMMNHPLVPTLYDDPVLPYSFKNWPANHVWLHKQPMTFWPMMVSMLCFGVNEIAIRIPSILMTTLGIVITYKIAKHLFNDKIAFIAALFYSMNGLIIELTSGRIATDHVDITFLFFIQLAILCAIEFTRKDKFIYNLLCGICIGAAILTKWLPALIVLPIWGLLLMHYKNISLKKAILHGGILIMVIVAVALPWQIYIYTYFPQEAAWEAAYNRRHLYETLEGQSSDPFYYLDKIRLVFGEMMYIVLPALGIWLFKKRKDIRFLILAVWIFVPLIFFSLVATKMQGYMLFTAPAIFIASAYFWRFIKVNKFRLKFRWLAPASIVLLIALPARYTIERMKPFKYEDRAPTWVSQLKKTGRANQGRKRCCIQFKSSD